jgi:(p)ppGpp synthase/HD superfamily hydrolase
MCEIEGSKATRRRIEIMKQHSSFLTWRFDLALQFASGLHHEQARKGVPIPYVAHLMGVSSLVLEAGGDEDQAIAALLHDAVEDQGGLSNFGHDSTYGFSV